MTTHHINQGRIGTVAPGLGRRVMRAALLRSAAAAWLLSVAACVSSVPPPALIPEGPAMTRVEDLTGNYCYYGNEFNVRSYRRAAEAIPFVDVRALGTPTLVSVRATPEQIVFRYTGSDGSEREQVFKIVAGGDLWRKDALVVKNSQGVVISSSHAYVVKNSQGVTIYGSTGTGTDYSGGSRESRLFKLADGRLVMSDSVSRKGYSEDPGGYGTFYESRDSVAVILDPAIGGCDAETTNRPLQPWFGTGPDLREAACAAQFEKQLAAILVEEGETPESAATLAAETLESLHEGLGNRFFSVSSESGARFSFEVRKKGSGGVLHLTALEKPPAPGWNWNWSLTMPKRPLPGCTCND
jgi:hypothetical protein